MRNIFYVEILLKKESLNKKKTLKNLNFLKKAVLNLITCLLMKIFLNLILTVI